MYLAHDEFLDRNAMLKVLRGWYEEDKQLGERVSALWFLGSRREAQGLPLK